MSTVDELLDNQLLNETSGAKPVCAIDQDTRIITIPDARKLFGVESDENAERVYFECPRKPCENVDLTQFILCINYENANGEKNVYLIEDAKNEGENLTFSWLLSRNVTKYKGTVNFIFCAKRVQDNEVIVEWNTIPAQGIVEQGLEATQQIEEHSIDVLEQVLVRLVEVEEIARTELDNEELKDIRKSYDEKTYYPSAGAAVRGQIHDLHNCADELSEAIDDAQNGRLSLKIIENEYISSNIANDGVPIKYDGWDRTDYTDCEGYDYLYIKSNKETFSNNAFYDANKEFISLFSINKANKFTKVNVPQNAKYFVLSGERSTVLSLVVKSKTGIVVEDFDLTTDIRGTKQTITFNADGTPNKVTYTDAKGNAVRTDTFAYSGDTITETRVMSTGTTMKITFNKKTLTTEVE